MIKETKMKIAVSTNDQKRVSGHLGRCRAFKVFEIEDGNILSQEIRENVFTYHRMEHQHHGEGGGHSHTRLIEGLKDCSYVISSGGGWRIVEDLKQNNIQIIFTDVELIDEAIKLFINGELKDNPEMTCNHN